MKKHEPIYSSDILEQLTAAELLAKVIYKKLKEVRARVQPGEELPAGIDPEKD